MVRRLAQRGDLVGVGRKGKGTTALVLMDNDRTPLGAIIAAANEHETRHIERLLDASVVELPRRARLLYDGAADSEPLRRSLRKRGVAQIASYRKWKGKPARRLRNSDSQHYRGRWKVERTFSWLKQCRRLAMRW